jgi:hypothetical protein
MEKKEAVDAQSTTLDANEKAHLVFMREEEKLARDVYITLGMKYPDYHIFSNIYDSEQRHTCAVCDMLSKYGVDYPNTDDNVGVYTGMHYGAYFTEKYNEFVAKGSQSVLDAPRVGALIEELDMKDIGFCPKEIIDQDNGMDSASDCGNIYTDNPDVQQLYMALLEGSERHLRAFVKNIEKIQGEGTYTAQYLTQEEVNLILGRRARTPLSPMKKRD